MAERTYLDDLEDIVDSAAKAESFVEGLDREAFLKDAKSSFAVVRAIEIIGEASKQIPRQVTDRYPELPWSDRARMRDKLTHGYTTVNLVMVWKTVQEDLPVLRRQLAAILERETDEE